MTSVLTLKARGPEDIDLGAIPEDSTFFCDTIPDSWVDHRLPAIQRTGPGKEWEKHIRLEIAAKYVGQRYNISLEDYIRELGEKAGDVPTLPDWWYDTSFSKRRADLRDLWRLVTGGEMVAHYIPNWWRGGRDTDDEDDTDDEEVAAPVVTWTPWDSLWED